MENRNNKAANKYLMALFSLLAILAGLWYFIVPRRDPDDETTLLEDIANSITIYNPFMSAKNTSKAIIKKWEGLRLKAYLCSASVPTIGWGTTWYKNGTKVKLGDTITAEQAEIEFNHEFEKKWNEVITRSKVKLTDGFIAAAVSFAYNLGSGALFGSTLWKRIQAGESPKAVKDEWMKWINARVNGVLTPIQGLVNRRKDEQNLSLQV